MSLVQHTAYEYLKYLRDTDGVPDDIKRRVNQLCTFLSLVVGIENDAVDAAYAALQREVFNYVTDNYPESFSDFFKSLSRDTVQAVLAEAQ